MFKDRPELETKIETEGAQAVLAGEEGVSHYSDYQGEPVIGAHYLVEEANWALVVEVNEAEVLELPLNIGFGYAGAGFRNYFGGGRYCFPR